MVLHSCRLRNAGIAQELEQDSVIHEVMLTKTILTGKRTDYFQVSFAFPQRSIRQLHVFWRGVSLAWPCLTSRLGVCRSFMTWDLMMLILDLVILI